MAGTVDKVAGLLVPVLILVASAEAVAGVALVPLVLVGVVESGLGGEGIGKGTDRPYIMDLSLLLRDVELVELMEWVEFIGRFME